MAVTPVSFAKSLLTSLGAPTTNQNLRIIVGWESAEGGAGPQFNVANNTASYNPINTTQPMPGSSTVNSAGVQAYVSWTQGLQATVQTLTNGFYPAILAMLQTGTASSSDAASTIDSSQWGTHDLTAALITGADLSKDGDSIAGTLAEGIAGAGGTGLGGDTKVVSPWVVGDSTNPDQDYWTTMNQYAQDAQMYLFSDGQDLILADGFRIMGQRPKAVLSRFHPNILSGNLTYDNTSFQGTHTQQVRGTGVQRRATLAKTPSPTQITITIVCDIDAFQAGDVIYLDRTWGIAYGLWLVGNTTRVVFQPATQLTLVQGMVPLNALSGLALGTEYSTGKGSVKPTSGTVIANMIAAATTINNAHVPYVYGGGHGQLEVPSTGDGPGTTVGFDCSGAVSAVLGAAGLLDAPQDTATIIGALQGKIGNGSGSGTPQCTIYVRTAEPGAHVFLRMSTSNGGVEFWGTADANAQGAGLPQAGTPYVGDAGWIPGGQPPSLGSGFATYHILQSVLGESPSNNDASTGGVS